MHQRILIPLDGSELAEASIPFVEELLSKLAPEVQKEVILLQVLRPIESSSKSGWGILPTQEITKREEAAAAEYLNKAAEPLKSKGASVTTRVAYGDPGEDIVRVANEAGANMIAMSSHGRSGITRWTLGSVADKVLRNTDSVPVMLVRAEKR